MASTDLVPPVREELFIGDTAYRRVNSEAIMSRFAATNNFINTYQVDQMRWPLNGSYSVATGITLFDGLSTFFYNSELTGVYFWNGQVGSAGITDFDIIWINSAGVTQGSIFSVTPKIDTSSATVTRGFKNLVTLNDFTMTGVTLPVFSKTTFLEGESVYLKLNSAMTGAQNCGLALHWRPTN